MAVFTRLPNYHMNQ